MENIKSLQTVVQGEASESEEESEDDVKIKAEDGDGLASSSPAITGQSGATVAVVAGEASESDEEEELNRNEIPALTVNIAVEGDQHDITSGEPVSPLTPISPVELVRPKYNSLLHRKLRERNVALRRHIVDMVSQVYASSAREVHNQTLQLLKTQIAIQEVSHHMRLSTNDLFQLEDKVDIVRSCSILPDINIDLLPEVTASEAVNPSLLVN